MRKTSKVVFAILLFASILVAAATTSVAESYRNVAGIVTANSAADTAVVARDFTPRGAEIVCIWSPDAECRIRITNSGSDGTSRTNYLVPASNDLQYIRVARADSIYIDKSTIQRVGVFFLGN